ncbi:cytochrome P450 [Herbaspirillum rubrisubalbicans]|uniref:Cytochrome P450 n=1 Tax=Herbaspirillum rubrisubalbicans Os34 TaxID=1235827 RepID=A0A6M3ZT66_9BURK|nr:cytochrome P450 [Herbaspirillum rubrisubalbicans]QJQ01453.1 cytochrome P450 [Herbaspirillum rubrisubalbicans Os34]
MPIENFTIPQHVPPHVVIDFDKDAPEGFEDDVHLAWAKLHDGPDIVWTPRHGGYWIATRAEDIDVMQMDHARFSHAVVSVPKRPDHVPLVPLELDPPEHTPFRALLSPAFGPKPVHELEADVRALTNSLIDGFIERGECEFVDEFAKRLPIAIFLQLVNLPMEDRDHLLELTEKSVRARSPADQVAAFSGLQAYVGKWIAERRARPGTDLFSKIVNARVDGREYTPQETFGMLSNVLFGGLDTVAATLGFVARCLAEQPQLRRELVADPALMGPAIEEFLRRYPVPQTTRVITHDFEYKGLQFKAGELIMLPKTLHSLDERRFPDPLKVDIRRKAQRHAGFGDGPHRCPGAGLARMEVRVFIEEWLRRIPEFWIDPNNKPRCTTGTTNAMVTLKLQWSKPA